MYSYIKIEIEGEIEIERELHGAKLSLTC